LSQEGVSEFFYPTILIKYNSREGGARLSKHRRGVNDGNVVSTA